MCFAGSLYAIRLFICSIVVVWRKHCKKATGPSPSLCSVQVCAVSTRCFSAPMDVDVEMDMGNDLVAADLEHEANMEWLMDDNTVATMKRLLIFVKANPIGL